MTKFVLYSFIVQSLFCSLALSHSSEAQGKRLNEIFLNVGFNQSSLEEVFQVIEQNTEFDFAYIAEDLPQKKITLNSKKRNLEEILLSIARQSSVSFKRVKTTIHVKNSTQNQDKLEEMFGMNTQTQIITGTVTYADNEPLPGVNVIEKGTINGTVTNADGEYTITVSENATLVFSSVGYLQEEVEVGNLSIIDMVMSEDIQALQEIVVVGYGTQNRQAVTGAVTVADLDTYREVPVNNIMETVKGTVPGLNVSGTNQAGQVAAFSIRGQNSTGASNEPLIVVDGAIYQGSLGDIPTADIANFTVLKDASAAAVYGARSANGVIIIETKRGSGIQGKPKFDVRLSYGISNELERLETYDADGYLQRTADLIVEKGGEVPDEETILGFFREVERENYLATPDHQPTLTDPFEPFRQYAYNTNANISYSNSTEKSNYYIAATVTDQKGVTLGDKFKNFSGRINLNSDITEWFNIGVRSFYTVRDYSGGEVPIGIASSLGPWASLYNEDGSYRFFPHGDVPVRNPFLYQDNANTDLRNNLNATVNGLIQIPWVKGLTYNLVYSNSLRWNESSWFQNEENIYGQGYSGRGSSAYDKTNNSLVNNIISYKNIFAEKHSVDVTLLYSVEQTSWKSLGSEARDFTDTKLMDYALEQGSTQTVNTGGGESAIIGQMARTSYTFNNKYSITGTIRRDGFSAFSENRKWGIFPSVGFKWNLSEESFIENSNVINDLGLRLSYGKNGNQAIEPYSTLATVGTGKFVYSGDNTFTIWKGISRLGNNNLGWETTVGFNVGIDFSILNNRLSGFIDGYLTQTNDLIFDLTLPSISGKSNVLSNIGEINNKGIEIGLHSINIQNKDFQWSSDFAFSLNRNEVETIFGQDNDGDGVEDDLVSDGYFIGRSLGTIYTTKVIGMWQQEDVDNGTIMDGFQPGDYRIEDLPNEDTGEPDGLITDADRQFLGVSKPNFQWSLTNTVRYKNLSLMAFVYSIWGGNDFYLATNSPMYGGYVEEFSWNLPAYDYWSLTNTDAEYPRMLYKMGGQPKANKYYDRSFIKLQKVTLSYDFTSLLKPVIGLNNVLLAFSADNLFTYAPHWEGLDPETGQGLTQGARPSIRTYFFSLSFNF